MAHCWTGSHPKVSQPVQSLLPGVPARLSPARRGPPPTCAAPCESLTSSVPVTQPEPVPLTSSAIAPHPDAVARRRDAEQRKALRSAALAELAASDSCWWHYKAPANMVVVNTAADFEQTLRAALTTHKLCVVDYFAPWCHACRTLYPKLRQIAEVHSDVLFIKANAENEEMRRFFEASGVRGLPYFRFHASGQIVHEFPANLYKVGKLRDEIAAMKAKLAAEEPVPLTA